MSPTPTPHLLHPHHSKPHPRTPTPILLSTAPLPRDIARHTSLKVHEVHQTLHVAYRNVSAVCCRFFTWHKSLSITCHHLWVGLGGWIDDIWTCCEVLGPSYLPSARWQGWPDLWGLCLHTQTFPWLRQYVEAMHDGVEVGETATGQAFMTVAGVVRVRWPAARLQPRASFLFFFFPKRSFAYCLRA